MSIILTDIGATNARFAHLKGESIQNVQVFKCADYENFYPALKNYLEISNLEITELKMAIAAPIRKNNIIDLANNHWGFHLDELKQQLGLDNILAVNDFKAVADSVPYLKPEDLTLIKKGIGRDKAPIGVIGPGTGLGVASIIWHEGKPIIIPTESGHLTVPASNEREFQIYQSIKKSNDYSHISSERIVSGKGLYNIYSAIKQLDDQQEAPILKPSEISNKALNNECDLCVEALNIFCSVFAVIASNLALSINATGGIYIAGGIIPQILPFFQKSDFNKVFIEKGRYSDYMNNVPVNLIKHEYPAFIGLQNIPSHSKTS